jgi:adenine-specific DNA-methyltransferase
MELNKLSKLSKIKLLEKCQELGITKCKSKNKCQLIYLISNLSNLSINNVSNAETEINENTKETKETKESINEETKEINIDNSNFDELINYYDTVLNLDKSTYKSSNDEPTPIHCIIDMLNKIPEELWERENLSILDPCCGNGNFALPTLFKLINKHHSTKYIVENIIHFNDINVDRLNNVKKIYCENNYELNITNYDYLSHTYTQKYDLVMANPPYAKLLENGKRASKNHNLIKDYIEKSLQILKPNGYLLFITPDNWMSYADRNCLIETLTSLQIIHLDIHSAKKYFKKIGSSFTWYVIQNCNSYKNMNVSGIWKKNNYESSVISCVRKYIPLVYNNLVYNILQKTIDNVSLKKFNVKTSSDLHKYTKAEFINDCETEVFKYKLIHTPKQTVYSSRPHKFQDGYKVFISTTDKYQVFIDNCGMTQSIVFIQCIDETQAKKYLTILQHPLYVFLNNICRWGNFNNIRILQSFPIPDIEYTGEHKQIYSYFNISLEEIDFINNNL